MLIPRKRPKFPPRFAERKNNRIDYWVAFSFCQCFVLKIVTKSLTAFAFPISQLRKAAHSFTVPLDPFSR